MKDANISLTEMFRERRGVFLRVLARRVGSVDEAEEVFQEACINFSRAAEQEEITNPDGYLMQIALNLAVDRIRQDASRRRREENWFETTSAGQIGTDYVAAVPAPDQAVVAKQELQRLEASLKALSLKVRTAFILHKVKGLSHVETAQKMGLSRSTVEKHIMKAMKHVMSEIADE